MARQAPKKLEGAHPGHADPRDRIVRSAARLFRERGYAATSLRDVATDVGMSKAGLYHHFASKDRLLEQVCERAVAVLEADLREVLAVPGTKARIRTLVVRRVRTIACEQDVMTVFWQERPRIPAEVFSTLECRLRKYRKGLLGLMEQGQREGVVRSDLDPYLLMVGLDGMTGWLYLWYREGGRLSIDQIAAQLWELGWSGVRS